MGPGELLMARLGLDTSGFKAGLKEAQSSVQAMAKILGAGFSAAGAAEATREIIEYGARVYDLGKRFGVSTDAIQKFGSAAAENGSSMEGMTKGFNKLEIAISRALGGNAQLIQAFAHLGISVADLRNLSPEELMQKLGKSSMNAADMVSVLGKSALELRPVLAGLADGTIELGDAIDSATIQRLKEADEFWKKTWRSIKIVSAESLGWVLNGVKGTVSEIGRLFGGMRTVIAAEFLAIKAAATGNFAEVKRQAAIAAGGLADIKGAFTPLPDKPAAASRRFDPTGDGGANKSKAELDADKKERERDQLSLKDLQTEGAQFGQRKGDMYTANTGTAQMIYAAQQARLVEQLEGQAKKVRLTGISPTGESSGQLLSRADAIRQTLPIKETEKEVGIYRQAFKESLSGVEEKLDNIEAQLE